MAGGGTHLPQGEEQFSFLLSVLQNWRVPFLNNPDQDRRSWIRAAPQPFGRDAGREILQACSASAARAGTFPACAPRRRASGDPSGRRMQRTRAALPVAGSGRFQHGHCAAAPQRYGADQRAARPFPTSRWGGPLGRRGGGGLVGARASAHPPRPLCSVALSGPTTPLQPHKSSRALSQSSTSQPPNPHEPTSQTPRCRHTAVLPAGRGLGHRRRVRPAPEEGPRRGRQEGVPPRGRWPRRPRARA
jgi:hypothetical protein